ncbi:DNA gyrase subunit B [Hibiscus syriacus]|uniref:DNA gyrase subunit B n=1 Tax=Hibiscus syriacus TaxID=106335 RepID=A0A6A2YMF4_HIBSY|nr:DNA gyrase subunit B [Hibiscus syriacus]
MKGPRSCIKSEAKISSASARYWVLFDQKENNQIGFQVKIGQPKFQLHRHKASPSNSIGKLPPLKEETKTAPKMECGMVLVPFKEKGTRHWKRRSTYYFAANLVSYRAGGDWSTTYAPSPFYMTSKMRSLYLEGYNYSIFDLTRYDRVQVQIHGKAMQGRILHGNSPLEIIEHFTETIGRPPELPEWVISGAVVGMQGGTETDWVGQRETLIGSQLWWNWEVDVTRYPEWQQLVKDLGTNYIKVMTYCNPCLALVDEKPNKRRNLFEEAKELDIASWFKQILQEMVVDGVRGWMADFGEGLPVDAVLYSGEDPISAHNKYPELWAQINREFVEEWKNNHAGKEREDLGDLVFFMRAGFRDSPRWGCCFGKGTKCDIGGYCTINLPVIKYCRRNKPRCNSQFYSNEKTLSHFARFAKVYKAWKFYRVQLVKEAAQKGLPVCRHLFLHYPDDERVQSLSYQQFLVGSDPSSSCPLQREEKCKSLFPVGETCAWKHIWTGKLYQNMVLKLGLKLHLVIQLCLLRLVPQLEKPF